MDLNAFPTDSLYKFCSISGSVAVFYCIYLFMGRVDAFFNDVYILKPQVKELEVEQAIQEQYLSELKNASQAHDADFKNLKDSSNEIKKNVVKLQGKVEILNHRKNFLFFECVVLAIFLAIGVNIAYYGYTNWYNKIQKFQDTELEQKFK